ncbi:MAG: MqnA/MqnD/SBP family protein, partial [Miltoncostaeaceae bacterium]
LGPEAPAFTVLDGPAEAALATHDGVLLIADEALGALGRGIAPHHTDLAAVWHRRTGLPMVFAVWAARAQTATERPAALRALADHLVRAREAYLAEPEAVVRAAAARFPFPEDFIRPYLARLTYDFGASEQAGLSEFLRQAAAAGELASAPVLAA